MWQQQQEQQEQQNDQDMMWYCQVGMEQEKLELSKTWDVVTKSPEFQAEYKLIIGE